MNEKTEIPPPDNGFEKKNIYIHVKKIKQETPLGIFFHLHFISLIFLPDWWGKHNSCSVDRYMHRCVYIDVSIVQEPISLIWKWICYSRALMKKDQRPAAPFYCRESITIAYRHHLIQSALQCFGLFTQKESKIIFIHFGTSIEWSVRTIVEVGSRLLKAIKKCIIRFFHSPPEPKLVVINDLVNMWNLQFPCMQAPRHAQKWDGYFSYC